MRAIPESLRGVITTRRYTNPCLPYLSIIAIINPADAVVDLYNYYYFLQVSAQTHL